MIAFTSFEDDMRLVNFFKKNLGWIFSASLNFQLTSPAIIIYFKVMNCKQLSNYSVLVRELVSIGRDCIQMVRKLLDVCQPELQFICFVWH